MKMDKRLRELYQFIIKKTAYLNILHGSSGDRVLDVDGL